ncbi:TSNA1 protein, partial [Centropus bengalensis]|nr:TSNA1 protein [Centropus bengalensis]
MDASGPLAPAPSGSRSPMFPAGAEREDWGPRFNCAPSTSAAASQAMPASGRKRKANFSNDETETLVWNVVRHFSALYGSEALRAHPVRRKQLWTQIQSRVNFLGYTERSIDDLKHKWRDLRLDVKKKITSKKHLPVNRAGGPLHKPRLTPLEKMVASTFLQASHDSEPEIILDPGEPWRFGGHHGEGGDGCHLLGGGRRWPTPRSQPPWLRPHLCSRGDVRPGERHQDVVATTGAKPFHDSSLAAESGPELRTPDVSAISPSLRNESLVSYASMSEEEERDGREVERSHGAGIQPGADPPTPTEEDIKVSRQAMLIRRCSSQGSVTSLHEDSLNPTDAPSDWGHEAGSELPPMARDSSHPEEQSGGAGPELGALPRVLMGPTWEKPTVEEEPPTRSPLHGAMTEES